MCGARAWSSVFCLQPAFVTGCLFFFFQAEDGIRYLIVTGVQTCALPISAGYTFDGDVKLTVRLSGQRYRELHIAVERVARRDPEHRDDRTLDVGKPFSSDRKGGV